MYRYEFMRDTDNYIDVQLVENPETPAIWMTFDVPCKDEAGNKHILRMCDYTSAGNTWQEGNLPRMGATAVRFPSPVHEQRGLARQRDRRRRASRDSGHL